MHTKASVGTQAPGQGENHKAYFNSITWMTPCFSTIDGPFFLGKISGTHFPIAILVHGVNTDFQYGISITLNPKKHNRYYVTSFETTGVFINLTPIISHRKPTKLIPEDANTLLQVIIRDLYNERVRLLDQTFPWLEPKDIWKPSLSSVEKHVLNKARFYLQAYRLKGEITIQAPQALGDVTNTPTKSKPSSYNTAQSPHQPAPKQPRVGKYAGELEEQKESLISTQTLKIDWAYTANIAQAEGSYQVNGVQRSITISLHIEKEVYGSQVVFHYGEKRTDCENRQRHVCGFGPELIAEYGKRVSEMDARIFGGRVIQRIVENVSSCLMSSDITDSDCALRMVEQCRAIVSKAIKEFTPGVAKPHSPVPPSIATSAAEPHLPPVSASIEKKDIDPAVQNAAETLIWLSQLTDIQGTPSANKKIKKSHHNCKNSKKLYEWLLAQPRSKTQGTAPQPPHSITCRLLNGQYLSVQLDTAKKRGMNFCVYLQKNGEQGKKIYYQKAFSKNTLGTATKDAENFLNTLYDNRAQFSLLPDECGDAKTEYQGELHDKATMILAYRVACVIEAHLSEEPRKGKTQKMYDLQNWAQENGVYSPLDHTSVAAKQASENSILNVSSRAVQATLQKTTAPYNDVAPQ